MITGQFDTNADILAIIEPTTITQTEDAMDYIAFDPVGEGNGVLLWSVRSNVILSFRWSIDVQPNPSC